MVKEKDLSPFASPNAIEVAYQVADDLMKDPRHVKINYAKARDIAMKMEPNLNAPPQGPCGWIDTRDPQLVAELMIAYELIANSVNYKYWYCRDDVRPCGAGAVLMYQLLDQAFVECKLTHGFERTGDPLDGAIIELITLTDDFHGRLTRHRFPMLTERREHLNELHQYLGFRQACLCAAISPESYPNPIPDLMDKLITDYSGYGADIFIKRASLLFMQLNRRMGWFADTIGQLPVPADYQVPKLLRAFGILEYESRLDIKVMNRRLIAEGSLEEGEIRAATILAVRVMADAAKVTTNQVDHWLWLNRKMTNDPFHLTITTNY